MSLCLQCSKKNILHNINVGLAGWIKRTERSDAVPPNAPLPSSALQYPSDATVQIDIQSNTKDGNVLFWAAKPKRIADSIVGAADAYGKYTNMGIARIKNGRLRLQLKSPQPYKEGGKVFPPHVHYVYRKGGEWQTIVHTIAAFPGHHGTDHKEYVMKCLNADSPMCCILTPQRLRRNWNKFIVVNALPLEYKGFNTGMKNTLHVPYDSNKHSLEKVCKTIKNKPYVVYCMHSKCHAASDLIAKLIGGGCMNVYYMPDGIEGWNQLNHPM